MFNRFKLFKINVLKAMFDAEQNQQQKDLLKAVMVDEFATDPDLLAIQEGIRKKEALKTLGLPEDTNLSALTGKVEDAVEVKAEKESEEMVSQDDNAEDAAEVSEDAEPVSADGVKLVEFHQEEESEEDNPEDQPEQETEEDKTPA